MGGHSTLAKQNNLEFSKALQAIDHAKLALDEKNDTALKKSFNDYTTWWSQNKMEIQDFSMDAFIEIGQTNSKISTDMLNSDYGDTRRQLTTLKNHIEDLQAGTTVSQSSQNSNSKALAGYIEKLETTKKLLKSKNWDQAAIQIKHLQTQWLSVEGDVVSQSQTVYADSEKDLVLLDAYISNQSQRKKAVSIVDEMIFSLKPLANTNYGMWDAALIPIREGLEALLVVGTLLTFATKAKSKPAKRWVWGGAIVGMLICIIVGAIVSFVLSSIAFGNNNTLINGWSGVIASIMLLYVSYWLHRNSDIKKWNSFIHTKSQKAMTSGRMLTFAGISFLAIVREGLETVIFLIGMVGKMSKLQLTGGIMVGFAILFVIGFLMLKVGMKLPLKPFFLISSCIVFYLCFKFMGSGVHSLQMAGVLPSTVVDYLPSISILSVYSSWYSLLPQIIFLGGAIVVLIYNRISKIKISKEKKEAV
jgi:high-affinity iron transporter